jgi:outer membrane protein assembly factor BamB
MVLIELDRDRPPVAAGRTGRRRPSRLWPAVLVAALVLTGLEGAVPSLRPLVPIASIPDAGAQDFALSGGILYQVEPDPAVPGRVAAYRLAGGDRLWSVALPEPVDLVLPAPPSSSDAGVLLAQSFQATARAAVSAVDTGSGRLLWRAAGDIGAFPTGRSIVVLGAVPGSTETRAVDLRSGATVWRRSLGDGSYRVAAADNDDILLVSPDGGVEVLDAGTGRLRATGRPLPGQLPLDLDGGALYAVSAVDDREIHAYDLATLAQRWSARLPDPPDTVWSCGSARCASAGRVLLAVDPDTGRVRWRQARLPGERVDLGGRTVTFRSALGDAFTSTGRTSVVYRTQPNPVTDLGPPLYTMEAGTGSLLVRLDPATARRQVLGLLPAGLASSRCHATGGYLACDISGRYLAWRYPD